MSANPSFELTSEQIQAVSPPIDGDPSWKNLLSMRQFSGGDIAMYIAEAEAAEGLIWAPCDWGADLLPNAVLKAVMRQPSTRTAGSMTTAMYKLGGRADLVSGMEASSEAKGESLADSWVAFATQADIIGTRTAEDYGPAFAAHVIGITLENQKTRGIDRDPSRMDLRRPVPVINLGDGRHEHPTQALGDLFTIHKHHGFDNFQDLTLVVVGDHERYRAHHSLLIGAHTVGMHVIAVESEAAPVPEDLVDLLGDGLERFKAHELDDALREADVLYVGRKPDEYAKNDNSKERGREDKLTEDYLSWVITHERIQQMSGDSIVLHPRPRKFELHPSVDTDHRMRDVQQMANMIPMRMAILAQHLGVSIRDHVARVEAANRKLEMMAKTSAV